MFSISYNSWFFTLGNLSLLKEGSNEVEAFLLALVFLVIVLGLGQRHTFNKKQKKQKNKTKQKDKEKLRADCKLAQKKYRNNNLYDA